MSQAIEHLSVAVALDPDAVRLRYENMLRVEKPTAFMHAALGICYTKRARDKAQGHFISALIYEPDSWAYLSEWVSMLVVSKEPVNAIEAILRARRQQFSEIWQASAWDAPPGATTSWARLPWD